jgi:S-adenosylmethionine hydrolase
VGGPRDALLVEARGRTYLGPDNGILSWATRGARGRAIRVLADPRFRLGPVSRTFHGRDVFAPAAAHLAAGVPPRSFGPARRAMTELPPLRATLRRGAGRGAGSARPALAGTVAYVDVFGNAITSIRSEDLRRLGRTPKAAAAGGASFPWRRYYAEAGPGGRLCLVGSCGLVELAVNGGSAADERGLRAGDAVLLS